MDKNQVIDINYSDGDVKSGSYRNLDDYLSTS